MSAGCAEKHDALEVEKFDAIRSTISIQFPVTPNKPDTGLVLIISPNGAGSFFSDGKKHKIGKAKYLYDEAVAILGPLQNYAGTESIAQHGLNPKKKMNCGPRVNDFKIGLVFWKFNSRDLSSKETAKYLSQYEFSCGSPKAAAATRRIKAVVQKFEEHVQRSS